MDSLGEFGVWIFFDIGKLNFEKQETITSSLTRKLSSTVCVLKKEQAKKITTINNIQDGHFQGCSRMGESKRPLSLKSVTHILQ